MFFQMTGLDIDKDQIIEMACIVTDAELNILAEVRWEPSLLSPFLQFLTSYSELLGSGTELDNKSTRQIAGWDVGLV